MQIEFLSSLCGIGLLLALAPAPQQPPTPVRIDPVRSEKVEQRRQVSGSLRAAQRAAVAAREAGVVVELLVREGQRVERGAVLARQDARSLELELAVSNAQAATAEATLVERQGELAQAERDLEALRGLAQSSAANPKELLDAETSLATSRARFAWAERSVAAERARIDLANKRIGDLSIQAPFAGLVTRRMVENGEWLAQGGAVCELASIDALEAWLDVPQESFGAVQRAGATVEVWIEAADVRESFSLTRCVADVDARSRTFSAIVAVPARPALAPGMAVSAWIGSDQQAEALTIARDALLRNANGPFVYVAAALPGASGAAAQGLAALPQSVEVLFQAGSRWVVKAPGLKAGMNVIVEGNERLYPSAPIVAVEPPAERAGADGR